MDNQIGENKNNFKPLLIILPTIFAIFVGIVFFAIYRKESSKINMNIIEQHIEKPSNNQASYTSETTKEEIIEEHDYYGDDEEDVYGTNRTISDCSISKIKGVKLEFKNTNAIDGIITSDIYINGTFSHKITYYDNCYNECEVLKNDDGNVEEFNNDYFLLSFASEGATWSDAYLFSKSGKYISNFDEWRKKYKDTVNKDGILPIVKVGESSLELDYIIDYGWEQSIQESYCEVKAKPDDIYRVTEYVSIEDDKLKVEKVVKKTWAEEVEGYSNEKIDFDKINCQKVLEGEE